MEEQKIKNLKDTLHQVSEVVENPGQTYNMPEVDDEELKAKLDALGEDMVLDEDTSYLDEAMKFPTMPSRKPGADSIPAPGGYVPYSPEVHFEPIVKLPLVEVKTLEENKETLFTIRAKLFRYDSSSDPAEWKERGTGDIKILKHDTNVRILMRRDKTLKICANHYIQPCMELKAGTSGKAWVWSTMADFAEEEPKPELLAIKFANVENAQKFKRAFNAAKELSNKFQENNMKNLPGQFKNTEMSHSSAMFSTDFTQEKESKCISSDLDSSYEDKIMEFEKIEKIYLTTSDLDSSYEEEISVSETENSDNEYKSYSKELSQIKSKRRKSFKTDDLKRRKILAVGLPIISPSASNVSTTRDSAFDCSETFKGSFYEQIKSIVGEEEGEDVPESIRERIKYLLEHPETINIHENLEKELSKSVKYPPLKESYEDVFGDLENTTFPVYDDDFIDVEKVDLFELIKDSLEGYDGSFSGYKFDKEHQKVTSATPESDYAELREKFLSELCILSHLCNQHNAGHKKDSKIVIEVQNFLHRLFNLGRQKVHFEENSRIASLILPVIKHIVFVVELSVIQLKSRIDLLEKKSGLKFLVDSFGEQPVGDKQGKNLSFFLKKPVEYCNSLLDNVLLKLRCISSDDEYDIIDNSGIPEGHSWWYEEKYLHRMTPKT